MFLKYLLFNLRENVSELSRYRNFQGHKGHLNCNHKYIYVYLYSIYIIIKINYHLKNKNVLKIYKNYHIKIL